MSATIIILGYKKSLIAAVAASRNEEVASLLKTLKKEVVATEELIRETKIGMTVSKLRQNGNKEIADLAKEIVRKWKNDVGPLKTKTDSPMSPATLASPAQTPGTPPVKTDTGPAPFLTGNSIATTSSTSVPDASTSTSTATSASTLAASTSESTTKPAPRRRDSLNGAPRTHKTDEIAFGSGEGSTGDKTREKCAEMIYDALASDSDAPSELILKRARALESHVHSLNPPPDGTNAYRTKMRSLFLNLKAANNPSLREDLVSGDISVARLCNMTAAEMASDAQQAMNRKLVEQNLFKVQGAAPQEAETDGFQCGKCKQRKCRYYQLQTRSADEPMTTFVTCCNCGNKWKFS